MEPGAARLSPTGATVGCGKRRKDVFRVGIGKAVREKAPGRRASGSGDEGVFRHENFKEECEARPEYERIYSVNQ
jgi:hypothetical protein